MGFFVVVVDCSYIAPKNGDAAFSAIAVLSSALVSVDFVVLADENEKQLFATPFVDGSVSAADFKGAGVSVLGSNDGSANFFYRAQESVPQLPESTTSIQFDFNEILPKGADLVGISVEFARFGVCQALPNQEGNQIFFEHV